MAETAKSARGAAALCADTLHTSRLINTHDGKAQRPWESHGIMENQRITKVGRTSTASMAIQTEGAKCPLHGAQRKQKMKGKKS
ncbi:hypothetical protein [Cupriavidus sp. PET2-C1]